MSAHLDQLERDTKAAAIALSVAHENRRPTADLETKLDGLRKQLFAARIRKSLKPANDPPRLTTVDPLDGVCDEPAAYDWRRTSQAVAS